MLELAVEVAKRAGKVMRENFGKELKIDKVSRHDIKLEIDRKCEEVIIGGIRKEFPEHGILSEEAGEMRTESEYQWVIDPLDGTVNFARSVPHFCTSIALRKKNEVILGVVYDPMREELFTGERGKGARLGEKPLAVSRTGKLGESILVCGFSKDQETITRALPLVPPLIRKARKLRMTGCAALDLAYVASGRYDGYFEYGINLWDIAAASLILEEAGGKGEILHELTPTRYDFLASNGRVHAELRDMLLPEGGDRGSAC